MAMTRKQIVEQAEAWVAWWKRLDVDTVACLTIDPTKGWFRHHAQLVKAVKALLARLGYEGRADGVVERGIDGNWHVHIALQGNQIDREKLRSHWYHKYGRAMVRSAGQRRCDTCDDRPECSWKRHNPGGCGDLAYVARKLHLDRYDGGAIIEIDSANGMHHSASA